MRRRKVSMLYLITAVSLAGAVTGVLGCADAMPDADSDHERVIRQLERAITPAEQGSAKPQSVMRMTGDGR